MSDDASHDNSHSDSREKQRVMRLLSLMQAKLDAAERRAHEPVAVIGIGCRMPGGTEGEGVEDADAFWAMLEAGRDAVVEVPPERWDAEQWYDPDPDAPGRMNTRRGGFLRDIDLFDAEFFGISPREAISMDPQQRLVLEVAWRALEHAGLPPRGLAASRTGVYLGLCTSDYARLGDASGSLGALDTYSGTGGANGVAAGRLSYTLGLTGPSLVVDTACSSSLVATHLAVQALRAGECDLALAGGANLVLLPDGTVTLSRLHMMAPDGRCKAFDASADGFVRGEGCGIVVLKRLANAQADGNRVLAVIRGTAVNQDGRSAGLTAPSGLAQQNVVRAALADARLSAAEITYVEAHGTGTALGDPVEINALASVQGKARSRPLLVGSVKSNIGHLEAAAGIAGLIKTVESLRRGRIAPNLHFQRLNPHIQSGDCPVEIPTQAVDWPAGAPRLAGVSAFGFSGTNAHLVLEGPPPESAALETESTTSTSAPQGSERYAEILPLSANNAPALARLKDEVIACTALERYADACFSASVGRSAFAHRLAVVAQDGASAREALRRASGRLAGTPRIAFLFSGQGAQASGMGRQLYESEAVFRASIDRCAAVLDPLLGRSLTALMFDGGAELDHTEFAQPTLLAFELAMVDLLRDWGIEPEALIGHSLGEYAAAAVAGVMPFEDALRLVATRGRLMQALPAGGAMLAVLGGREQIEAILAADPRLALAADNGPAALTLSGPQAAIDAACAALDAQGIGTRRLAVSHAFHSALMEPALDAIEAAAAGIAWEAPRLPLIGNLDGEELTRVNAAYWRRHTRAPVAFAAGMRRLAALGCDTFVEVGPQPVLLAAGRSVLGTGEWIATARHGQSATTMEALARLFELGAEVRWERVHAGRNRRRNLVDLPGHPFLRQSYWRRSAATAQTHPLLTRRNELPDGRTTFHATLPHPTLPHPTQPNTALSDAALSFLAEHRVGETAIAPAALLLETATAAAQHCGRPPILSAISFEAALALDTAREIVIEITTGNESGDDHEKGGERITIHSRPVGGSTWTRHLQATLGGTLPAPVPVAASEATQVVDPAALHRWMRAGGIEHGPTFQRFLRSWRGDGVALASLSPLAAGPYLVHPALLDAAFQTLGVASFASGDGQMRIPVALDYFSAEASRPLDAAWAHVHLHVSGKEAHADVWLCDGNGKTIAQACGLHLSQAPVLAGQRAPDAWQDWLLERVWRDQPLPLSCEALAQHAARCFEPAETQQALTALNGLGQALDSAAAAYAARALRQVAPEEVAERHRALYARLPTIIAHAAKIDDMDGIDPDALLAELARRYPGSGTEIGLLQRCASQLAEVLTGRQDALQLLFPPGGDDNVYRDSPVSQSLNRCVEEAVLAALPTEGAWRILEAGAGTGGTTSGLLARLPAERIAEYAYTDISPSLLAAARRRHADLPWLTPRRLDIDRAPEEQGFTAGSYDIVLAANVVHAGLDLVASLQGLARLLTPRGRLILLEGAGPQGWIDLVFGLTEGWWRFTDRARRPDYPLPDRAGWLEALRAAGLTAEAVDARVGDVLERQIILVAQPLPTTAQRWLLASGGLSERSALPPALAERLATQRLLPQDALPPGDWQGCVYTGALDMAGEPPSLDALMAEQQDVLDPLRRLALACSARGIPLTVLTSGAHCANATKATVWGLGRAIAAELPDLALRLIDVDPALRVRQAVECLADELASRDVEDQVLISASGERSVARLVRVKPARAATTATALDPEVAYLVTGGFGGLGLHAACWLADRGARSLVLLGRSPPSPTAQQIMDELAGRGIALHACLGDVAAEDDVRRALGIAGRRIAGIVHAAGTLDDGVLAQLDWPRMARVLRAKVAGAWLLDRIIGKPVGKLADKPVGNLGNDLAGNPAEKPDFLLLYSSAVGLVGSRGQANHVAANAFLDALAAQRRARGEAALSIAWGAWSEIGSATDSALQQRLQASGMDRIPPDEAIHLLDWALENTAASDPGRMPACIGVLPVRWPAFARALEGATPPVLRELLPPPLTGERLKQSALADRGLRRSYNPKEIPQEDKNPVGAAQAAIGTLDLVLAEAAAVLAASGPEAIDPARSLFALGLDSLMAVELRNRLQTRLGRPLPSTLLFDHPAPQELAAYLDTLLGTLLDTLPSALDAPQAEQPAALRASADEAIAIIGMDCRLPGGASDPQTFWERLCAGFDAVAPLPAHRAAGSANPQRLGAFLDRVDSFDAAFFRIAPREAASMDPQQRLLLETAWHALERAGQAPDGLAGTASGVFIGVCNYDYPQLVKAAGRIDAWSATGGAPSIVAGRLAYTLGLEGPAMVVDTACSSSLVAVHLACRSLLAGECTLALAGGVNLILADSATHALSSLQMLSPDGHCKAFDARADGFVRGEGCGVLVLKRLSDAQANGDRVLAVIRGSSLNQDGRSSSLTAPSGRAQEAVIRQAVARAGVQPAQVSYVETHGTGTQLGDPIEINALKAVFGESHSAAAPLVLGALKSNLGHLEAAAGIAGLIKATLAVRHGRIPPNLHFQQLNPHISLDGLDAVFPTSTMDWPAGIAPDAPRVAGVSSFGFSGTNAHIVLQEAPPEAAPAPRNIATEAQLLALSAATPEAARRMAQNLADYLTCTCSNSAPGKQPNTRPPALRDLAYTLIAGRAQLDWRIAVIASNAEEAAALLREALPVAIPRHAAQMQEHAGENPTQTPAALAAAFLDGARLTPQALRAAGAVLLDDVPVYPFERQRHWIEAEANTETTAPSLRPKTDTPVGKAHAHPLRGQHHPLRGQQLPGPAAARRYQAEISLQALPWLADHCVAGVATLPAAAMLETMTAAAPGEGALVLEDIEFGALLEIAAPITLHTECAAGRITLHAAPPDADTWQPLASAALGEAPLAASPALAALRDRFSRQRAVAEFYAAFEQSSALGYGPAFRTVVELWQGEDKGKGEDEHAAAQALARLALPPASPASLPSAPDESAMRLHPALLDGAFQSMGAALEGAALAVAGVNYLPVGLKRFSLSGIPATPSLWAWSRVEARADGVLLADIDLLGEDGSLVARAEGLRLQPERQNAGRRAFLHQAVWRPATPGRQLPDAWHLLDCSGERCTWLDDLAHHLHERGGTLAPLDEAAGVLLVIGASKAADEDGSQTCAQVLSQVQTLLRQDETPQLWIVAEDAAIPVDDTAPEAAIGIAAAAVAGLLATLRLEHPELRATLINVPQALAEAGAIAQALGCHGAMLALRPEGILERQLAPLPPGQCSSQFALRRSASGRIQDLSLVAAPTRNPAPGEVAIAVAASGLNFRDLMNVLGTYPGDAGELGGECAGYVTALGAGVNESSESTGLRVGQAVMAITSACHASHVLAPAELTLPLPRGWSLEQAGSSPTAYLTAAWALRECGAIQPGQSVLIHAGSGGLGLAAIAIARAAGAEVLATAGSAEKRRFLLERGVACVADSRSTSFVDAVLAHTGGRGVDLVLNALSGELIAASFAVLRQGGCFLEVGKAGIWSDEQARAHRPDVDYQRIALDRQIVAQPAMVGAFWRGLLQEFESGALAPLPATRFALHDAATAYRHMQQAKHIGRIVLTRRFLRADAAYLVSGGSGALGLAVASWLLERGAGRVVLAARHPPSPSALAEIERLQAMFGVLGIGGNIGGKIDYVQADVANRQDVDRLLAGIETPLAGVIHAAGVLDDGVLEQLSAERLQRVFAPKVLGALHLDAATRSVPLDFFVLFSSAAGVLGSAGQANYAAANAALDAIAWRRRARGQAALAVDWGAWAGGGFAARRKEKNGSRSGSKAAAMAPAHALEALEELLRAGHTQALVLPEALAADRPPEESVPAHAAHATLAAALAAVSSSEQRALLGSVVRREVATILSLPETTLDALRPLNEYGLDSLMAVELRNALAALADTRLPSSLLFDYPSIDALSAFLFALLVRDSGPAAPPEASLSASSAQFLPPATQLPDDTDAANADNDLSEEALAEMLRKELERAGY